MASSPKRQLFTLFLQAVDDSRKKGRDLPLLSVKKSLPPERRNFRSCIILLISNMAMIPAEAILFWTK
ncbi:hypothetical protein Y1Q_0003083 [Alligator mississippiensis]|uniref:Uncharacterized protein n=1 Tax=Alligator mississippiensis TaxID=8496 RepID=A0A151MDC7_ALLMI|nr:hypothetical protein Y1Q_0003083 [Alligator mississippiensis]